ncbi:MAG: hypothetical protein EXX96DRAFT_537014 [Benjaminiella poitrasii]|nr:MAG: hypothetical protein EXX96DRAFT_537014 [Benjaminiella poitrasii]
MEEAVNKKKALKDEKVLVSNNHQSEQMKLRILKIMRLLYFGHKPLDYANEDSYLYFALSRTFKTFYTIVLMSSPLRGNEVKSKGNRSESPPKWRPKTFCWLKYRHYLFSMALVRKLKLFGLQFYNDQIFVYNLCKSCNHRYVFVQDFKFSVLGESSIFTQSMPTFFKNFYVINHLIENTCDIIDEMFGTADEFQGILEENNEGPSPYASPKKKQKQNMHS